MLTLVTGIPGGRKSAYCVSKILSVEDSNVVNLLRNITYFRDNKIYFESFQSEFLYNIEIEGTGDLIVKKRVDLPVDYFDIFESPIHERENLSLDYYYRLTVYNNICQRISDEYALTNYFPLLPVRFIYSNIAELKVDNVKSLEHLRDDNDCIDWRKAPLGSYIVIDEIQLIEPYRHVKLRDHPIIKELSTHRHDGYDIDIITQSTSYINIELKDLFEVHLHVTKPFGLSSKIFHYEQFQQNPNAISVRARAYKSEKFDPDDYIFTLYKSTKINNSESRTPWKMIFFWGTLFLICICLLIVISYWAYTILYPKPKDKNQEKVKTVQQTNVDDKKTKLFDNLQTINHVNEQKDIEIRQNRLDAEHLESIHNSQRLSNKVSIDNEIYKLRNERLTPTYYAERQDPTIAVRSVLDIGGVCTAYNIDFVKLNMTQEECNEYLKNGLPKYNTNITYNENVSDDSDVNDEVPTI